ncbi:MULTISPECIES: plasmid replication DNA-binding protein [Enterobacteriaceae]|uniref:plasmid replication DNA-binding protein n=1 Tax=Enterobacteriaceae TaxID=543 RepID=UPI0022F0BC4A|nr:MULTISPECIES: plasmid replication DNA-binding protein [Enterobacteriaceae]MDA4335838.1 plasmid replication DNA-binding protein [Escherichia coli]MDA4713761.1 plasmid replication DNA-binding protein [Enterobacter hormaechei]
MKKLSVSELAKLYGYSRQAIYAHINKGNLSKGSDGLIDFSEALRVFGEPQKKEDTVNQSQSINSQNLTEVDLLKRQVDILEKQLNQAIQRENQSLVRIPVKLNSDSGICEHHFRKVCGQGFCEQKLSFEGRHLFDSPNKPAAKRSAAVVDPGHWSMTVHLTSEFVL